MAKPRSVYVCQSCGQEHHKWQGKCKGCGEWNKLVEEIRGGDSNSSSGSSGSSSGAAGGYGAEGGDEIQRMADVESGEADRLSTEISELDRVLGGGLVPGGVVLLGGDPGIGKSTLSLQVAATLSAQGKDIIYISGEESLQQLKLRAERLAVDPSEIRVICETSMERVDQLLRREQPDLAIVDSIQTVTTEELSSSPGSVAQLKEVTGTLTQLAKGLEIPTLLIGHVTKDGAIAGPKVLEHMVDTVLYFEGQSGVDHRVLRAVKNRYGSTNEIGVFTMTGDGLEEVVNPSAMFLEERPAGASGSAVVPVIEGTRPLLVEVQGLVSQSEYGPPQVTAVGVDQNRVLLLLNIIEKRTGLKVAGHDVFVNVAGGMRVAEPAADLAIAMAVLSSYIDRPVPKETVVFGELGLTGEVRAVSKADDRLREAANLGFESATLPRGNADGISSAEGGDGGPAMKADHLDYCRNLAHAIRTLFGDDVLT
jgi:DNA repair protein RadA/Sms